MIDGAVAFLPVTPSLLTGLASIKEILSSFSLRNEAVPKGFEDVVGPAIAAMNDFRLARPSKPSVIAYGSLAAAPRCSLIIPLYGRVDFLEYQLALFSGSLAEDHEIIYVLDDPERMEETGKLAASAFARFQRPFTLVAMAQNSGFAPANNAGLRHARGKYVCFLNSDVFPSEPNWLEYMLGTLDEDPEAGVVGAVLLYEDGALQHDGCAFERLPEFGNWPFPIHPGKGLRTQNKTESCSRVEMVTGACMALRMPLARELGGFDEGFVIGDFEDADLCFRVRERGFTCVVDNRAVLYHLERQSQSIGASSWRMNLTLYNAWRFQKQWGERVR
jgi:GT2 family glycosyltransferase